MAETSWQIRTSSRIGIEESGRVLDQPGQGRAPRRCSSTRDLALIRLIRTRLVSAMASTPEAGQQHDDDDDEEGVFGAEARARRHHSPVPGPCPEPEEPIRPTGRSAASKLLLERLHPLGLGVVLVVHAEQVQQPVHHQQGHLVVEGHLVLEGVASGDRGADHDVTEQRQGSSVRAMFPGRCPRSPASGPVEPARPRSGTTGRRSGRSSRGTAR